MADTSKQMKAAMDAQIARGRERQANYYRSLGAVSGVGAAGAATGAAVGAPPVPTAAPVSLDSILMRSIAVPPTPKK